VLGGTREDIHDSSIRLAYGRVSTEYEDGIVGNDAGLQSLAKAIEQAIDTGESEAELHEFTNVYCKPDSFFPPEEAQELGFFGKTTFFLVVTLLLALVAIGGYTVFTWVFL